MKVVFIADAHLKGLDDPVQPSIERFFLALAEAPPSTLVILGDLFDFWTGLNDVVYYRYFPVLSALKELSRKTRIVYLEGNHDFLMGPFFTEFLGAEVYGDFAELAVEGKRIYLSHGDIMDRSIGYRILRRFLRSGVFRILVAALPPSFVWKAAGWSSKKSRGGERCEKIEKAIEKEADKILKNGFDCVILAHSHIAAVKEDGQKVYANPGSFREGNYLVYEDGKFVAALNK
jgi:UDP-2,3-diacylglucosamine hydrolase